MDKNGKPYPTYEEGRKHHGRKTFESFVRNSKIAHGENFDYSISKEYWKGTTTRIPIRCTRCNATFWQRPFNHVMGGDGCPNCQKFMHKQNLGLKEYSSSYIKSTERESEVMSWLQRQRIAFEHRKRFSQCRDSKVLSFNIFIPNTNMVTEVHNFSSPKWREKKTWGGTHHDMIKIEFCDNEKKNTPELFIISSLEKNVENVLNKKFLPRYNELIHKKHTL